MWNRKQFYLTYLTQIIENEIQRDKEKKYCCSAKRNNTIGFDDNYDGYDDYDDDYDDDDDDDKLKTDGSKMGLGL